jgi:hypothetical protein
MQKSAVRVRGGEMFLQDQLNQLGARFIDFDDLCAYAVFSHVYNFDHTFKSLVGEQFAPELQVLPDDQGPGAHDQEAAVAHILDDTRKSFFAGAQRTLSGDGSP